MDKFYFLVEWQKNKEATWSGTCWGLYNALNKHLNITDYNLCDSELNVFFHKCMRKLKIEKNDMNLPSIIRQKHKLRKKLEQKECTIFQFAEILPDTPYRKTYIYQDLSVDYIKYMYNNLPSTFAVSAFQNQPYYAIEKRALFQNEYYKNCSGIFTMGQWLAHDLIERCGLPSNKVHHVGGGINLDKNLISYEAKQGNKILFVGRDFKRKGGQIVLEAFNILKQIGGGKNCQLYVAGPSSDPMPQGMDGYHYMGDCDHKTLSNLFNLCDIFVMPSYFEAYGLVFIEALTYGLPCIGRNAYEMPYFIENGKTGFLLEKDSPDDLAHLMYRLLKDETIKANVRANKEWYIKEYSWDAVANRITKIIDRE